MAEIDWLALLGAERRGLRLGPPATSAELSTLEARLGRPLPADLRSLLLVVNGFEHIGGQWQCAWDATRIGIENERLRLWGALDDSRLAFGDNGAGEPFCITWGDGGTGVEEWSPVEHEAIRSWPSLAQFWADWLES